MNLTYEAIASDGSRVNDHLQAASVKEGIESLRRRGLMVTRIEPDHSHHADEPVLDVKGLSPNRVKWSNKQLMMFTRQMAMLLRAGSSLVPAIIAVSKQMRRLEHRRMMEVIREDLEEGKTLADAIRRFPRCFDVSYCAVIAAGESSATLPDMFERLGQMVNKKRSMQNRVVGALIYPALLITLSVAIMCVMMFFVMPRFAKMFESLAVELPASTKMLLNSANTIRSHWYVIAIVVAALAGCLVYLFRSKRGQQWLSDVQTRIFLVGRLMSRLIQAKTFRILGTLLEARVGLLDALVLARGVTRNSEFQAFFDRIDEAVTKGDSISAAMDQVRLINPSIVQAIRTGEQSGQLGEAITYAADIIDDENTELLNTLTRLVEPAILIFMGVVVGIVAISLFMPLFDMTSAV